MTVYNNEEIAAKWGEHSRVDWFIDKKVVDLHMMTNCDWFIVWWTTSTASKPMVGRTPKSALRKLKKRYKKKMHLLK